MLKISDAIKTTCAQQPLFAFGLHNKLFNLTALAKLLKPIIEARTKKEVKINAILMSLSRLQRQQTIKGKHLLILPIINTTIHSNLCSVAFFSDHELFEKINMIAQKIKDKRGYISIIQGINETNIIMDETFLPLVDKYIDDKPKNVCTNIASLNIKVKEEAYKTPGQFYYLVQAITLQGLNIYEISSAFSEVIFYLDQKDIKLAFDIIYNNFQNKDQDEVK